MIRVKVSAFRSIVETTTVRFKLRSDCHCPPTHAFHGHLSSGHTNYTVRLLLQPVSKGVSTLLELSGVEVGSIRVAECEASDVGKIIQPSITLCDFDTSDYLCFILHLLIYKNSVFKYCNREHSFYNKIFVG